MNVLGDPIARLVIGHRGDSAHFPENTAPSFDRAIELGVDAIEFDLRVTRDGAIVVNHDPTVDRTTDGTGAIAAMTLAQVRELDAGARFTVDGEAFPYRGQGISILTFDELLDRYRSIPLLIEVKVAAAVEGALRAIERHAAEDRVLMDSTASDAVEPFRGTRLLTGASLRDVLELLPRAMVGRPPAKLPYAALCIPPRYNGIPVPVLRLARMAHAVGAATHVWTINDPEIAAALWRARVNGIITDDPGAMLTLRSKLA
ncbi:MAG TPA: glycerophosphodiester phosphodiesterase family protein [Gemmatimonadaceae bacterium]|nr:glycerophosphodiester phosphodiesterase family protein [Gemmatimonadaceae bacterium]